MCTSEGERLRRLVDGTGMTLYAFASVNGIRPTTMTTITSGRSSIEKVRLGTFMRIAAGLGMTVEELYDAVADEPAPRAVEPDARKRLIDEVYASADETQRQHMYDGARLIRAANGGR